MEASGVVVRPPAVREARALAEVQVAAWRAAYRGAMPDGFLDALDVRRIAEVWRQRIAKPAAGSARLLAEDGGEVLGFAFLGPPLEAAPPGTGQLYALYVRPDRWARGIGSALFAAAEGELARLGYGRALLWVEEHNDRAIRFYTDRGWLFDGGTRVETGFGPPVAIRRHSRTLPGPAAGEPAVAPR